MKLERQASFRIEPTAPFDFSLTVRKPAGWNLFSMQEILQGDAFWTGIRSSGRELGLGMKSIGSPEKPRILVDVFARAPFPKDGREALRDVLSDSLGAKEDLNEFYAFARKDEILKHVVDDLYGMHDTQPVSLFNSVILSICLQMARPKRSLEMMDAIDRNYGETLEFDGKSLVIQPAPERIAKLDPDALAKRCKLGYRAKYIVASAKMISSGFPEIREISRMGPEDSKRKLMELPGIGDYAADIINPHSGFPIDAWSVDVFGLLFFGREPEDRREAIERVKAEGIRRWGKWSWMAFFYVAQDLERLSKRLGLPLRLE